MSVQKTGRQRQEWACQHSRLEQAEKELDRMNDIRHLSGDAWLQRRIGVQRKINRIRSSVRLPPIHWVQANAADRALQRRTAKPPSETAPDPAS